jgi:peptidoglycan/xylan/chitin deacetylase (PgdA/CDA1 family)
MKRIPILAYHGLINSSDTINKNRYNVSINEFAKQMRWLYASQYKAVTLEELIDLNSLLSEDIKRIVITFDDGYNSNFKYALPILKEYGYKVTLFITTDMIGKDKDFMDWQQVNELYKMGHAIQSHGHSHRFLNQLSSKDIAFELEQSKNLIRKFTNNNPIVFSCPGGRFDRRVIEIAKGMGYKKMFTSKPGYFEPENTSNSFLTERWMITDDMGIEQFKEVLEGNGIFLNKSRIRYFLKNILKKMIGEKQYYNIFRMVKNG